MKMPTHYPHPHRAVLSLIVALFLLLGASFAQAQKIDARPLTPLEIHEYGLPDGTQTSGGLLVVGIGEAVYLEAQVPKGAVVSGITWSIVERPLGGSTAQLQDTPLPTDMPIYSPGDREVLDAAGRKMLVPDVVGKYLVQAVVNTDGGTLQLQAHVTGARYVGVGTMAGNAPKYPQCALCHEDKALSYMETGHASMFTEAIDGIKSDHYGENCIDCHVLGLNPEAENGSFFDVANIVGWNFPEVLEPGNWAAMPDQLKEKANIQCEHCHGPGSEHHGDMTTTAVSLSSGDCGQCHDEPPYHSINQQWNISRHSVATRYPTGENRGACVRCHSGIGFIDTLDGKQNVRTDYEAIVCAACHDPHSVANEHQLRSVAAVTLQNGEVITAGGNGQLCMNCHMSRRDGPEYSKKYASHFGPHYSSQTDLVVGTNANEYGKEIGSTPHLYAVENSCVGCHMQDVSSSDPNFNHAGGHTWRMKADAGTPDDHSDDIEMVGACVDCHGPIDTFNLKTNDYNYDGRIEGVKDEIEHLMHALALKLPPVGEPTVEVVNTYTEKELKAAFNYLFIEEDGSHGMHNPRYAAGILQAAINDLTDPYNAVFDGLNIPMGGVWFYSPWFEFYSPLANGWVYHYEHGHIAISGDASNIYFYEDKSGKWRYTNAAIYPLIYDLGTSSWMYYYGRFKELRYFYSYSTNDWVVME